MRQLLDRVGGLLRGSGEGDGGTWSGVAQRAALTLVGGAAYGAAMGAFGGVSGDRSLQVLISAAKVPLLLLTTFAVCLPAFFVLNTLLGVRADFPTAVRSLAGGQAWLTVVLASLAPYTLLWYASSTDYGWAQLFNGLMFAVATFAAQGVLRRWYRPLIVGNPRHRWLLRAWLLMYTFVGIQMAWTLRPFVGAPDMRVQFFREGSWGNAYVIIGRMAWETLTR